MMFALVSTANPPLVVERHAGRWHAIAPGSAPERHFYFLGQPATSWRLWVVGLHREKKFEWVIDAKVSFLRAFWEVSLDVRTFFLLNWILFEQPKFVGIFVWLVPQLPEARFVERSWQVECATNSLDNWVIDFCSQKKKSAVAIDWLIPWKYTCLLMFEN